MSRLLIISKQKLLCEALARVLVEDEPGLQIEIEVVASYEDALARSPAKSTPDVILLHAGGTPSSVMSFLHMLGEEIPDTPVLLLTQDWSDDEIHAALGAGAAQCLDTSVDSAALLGAIALQGQTRKHRD